MTEDQTWGFSVKWYGGQKNSLIGGASPLLSNVIRVKDLELSLII